MLLPSFYPFQHLLNRHNYGDWWERVQQSQICFLCFEEEAWLMWEGVEGGVEGGGSGKWGRKPAESDNLTRQSNRQAQPEQILRAVNDIFQLKLIGPRVELQNNQNLTQWNHILRRNLSQRESIKALFWCWSHIPDWTVAVTWDNAKTQIILRIH